MTIRLQYDYNTCACYPRSMLDTVHGIRDTEEGGITNRGREERIYPRWAPIAEGRREYTRGGHQSRKGE
eukprot:1484432-Pyramimonas_sp.AAC.1